MKQTRKCGGCTACCTAVAVEELDKEEYLDCINQAGHGCSLHSSPDKPEACNEFICLWAAGMIPNKMRPDKAGAVAWTGEVMEGHAAVYVAKTSTVVDPRWNQLFNTWASKGLYILLIEKDQDRKMLVPRRYH